MANDNRFRPIPRTADEQAAADEETARLDRETPGYDELVEQGYFSDPTSLGDYLDFAVFMASARKERETRGLSIVEVADRMGVDHATVSRLESGKQANPTVNTVMRYVEAIGLRVAWGFADRQDAPVSREQARARRKVARRDAPVGP